MKNIKFLGLLCLSIVLLLGFALPTHSGSVTAASENKTLMQPQGKQGMATNATNIVLVHDKMTYQTKTYKFFKDYSSYINYK